MINIIFDNAKIIRSSTPYSFRLFFEKLEIFKLNSKRHKELFEKFQPEFLLALPIFPSEIFYIAYNKIINCPDKNCQNFKNMFLFDNENFNEKNENLLDSKNEVDYNYNKEEFFILKHENKDFNINTNHFNYKENFNNNNYNNDNLKGLKDIKDMQILIRGKN
jgi:hypothetical protein